MAQAHLSPETVDHDAVAKVAARVQISDIRQVVQHAALNCRAAEVPGTWTRKARIGFDCHVSEVAEDKQSFTVYAAFSVEYSREATESKGEADEQGPDIDISLIFELDYGLSDADEISEDDLEHFAFLNSTFNAWPYFRASVQTATGQMGIRPMVVPVRTVRPIAVKVEPSQTDEAE